ncbi:MAG: hypothetical protein QF685_06705 [Verrucomicrobiota bacterium]|nr:hypothetical protein [Verrucomicrobiota bacterium]
MENKSTLVGPGVFEQESQQLLLGIAMESSNRELQQLVNRRQKSVSLPGYYRSLQTWRSPVLHKMEA